MSQQIIFASVVAITLASGFAATLVAVKGKTPRSHLVAERLAQIALIGAGAIVALLSSVSA